MGRSVRGAISGITQLPSAAVARHLGMLVRRGGQSAADHDSANDECGRKRQKRHHPSPILQRMAQHTQEVPPVMAGDEGNPEISSCARDCDQHQKLSSRVVGSPCRREEHTRWSGQRNRRRGYQSPRAPLLEELQETGKFAFFELLVQIGRSCPAGYSKREVCPDHRPGSGRRGILVPQRAMTGRQDRCQDIRPGKRR